VRTISTSHAGTCVPGNLTPQLCTPEAVRPRRRLFLAYLHALHHPATIHRTLVHFLLLVITCFDVVMITAAYIRMCGGAGGQSASRAVFEAHSILPPL
jgi:hypothetical protein